MTQTFHIRFEDPNGPAGRDLIRLLTLEMRSLYPEDPLEGGADYSPETALETAGAAFVVARHRGTPVGCGAVRPLASDVGEVKRMFVMREARRRGVSKAILAALEDFAQVSGYERLLLQTGVRQPEAIAMYESQGYTQIACYGDYATDPLSLCFEKMLK